MAQFLSEINIVTTGAVQGLRGLTEALRAGRAEEREFNRQLNDLTGPLNSAIGLTGNLARAFNQPRLGLAASIAGTVVQGAQMGAQFGPGGVVAGGLLSMISQAREATAALNSFAEEMRAVRNESLELARTGREAFTSPETYEEITEAMRGTREQIDLLRRRAMELSEAPLFENPLEMGQRITALGETNDQLRMLEATMAHLEMSASSFSDSLSEIEEFTPPPGLVGGAGGMLAFLTMDTGLMRALEDTPETPRARGPATPETRDVQIGDTEATAPGQLGRVAEITEAMLQESRTAAELHEAEMARLDAEIDAREAVAIAARDQADATREAHVALGEAYAGALTDYGNLRATFGASIEEMISGFNAANEAARAAGTQVMSTGQGMVDVMAEVGETALKNVGEGMAQAFATGLAAVIAGGESFDKVMLKMTQSLLSNLLQMAIVEGLKELALGIADFASYRYDSGAMHMAAFGAWTAVAVAAGGALAGVSAAAGGGGSGGQPRAADNASRGQSSDSGESQSNTLNIYYNNPLFNTSEEQGRLMEEIARNAGFVFERA